MWRGDLKKVASMAEEAVNPAVDLPIGILGSLAAATGIYIAMSCVLTGEISPYLHSKPFLFEHFATNLPDNIPIMIFAR